MIKKFLPLIVCIAITAIASAQNWPASTPGTAKKKPGKIVFTKDPVTGVEYHFFKQDKKGKKAGLDNYVTINMVVETEGDSIIFDSRVKGGDSTGAVMMPLKKMFTGCLEQGVAMMSVGDSAAFRVSMDSILASRHMRGRAAMKAPFPFVVYLIKLHKVQTEAELKAAQQKAMDAIKQKEKDKIAAYVAMKGFKPVVAEDSLLILSQTSAPEAKLIQPGDSVYVTYNGKLLNDSVFDASDRHKGVPGFVTVNDRATLAMVYSPSMPLIKGWVVALGKMHEGDKIVILTPSWLAYGPRGAGGMIGPNTPLTFEMEVLKVTPHAGGAQQPNPKVQTIKH
jgi:FKBP-type peptidyl-prolyl cis-trans isomerase